MRRGAAVRRGTSRRGRSKAPGEPGARPLAYLDWAATALRPQAVLDAEQRFLARDYAAVHRGAHELAARATMAYEDGREAVAAFLGAAPEEISWTSNATDALNLVAGGLRIASRRGEGEARRLALREGDELLVPESEHHANLVPWQELAAETGAVLRIILIADDGTWTIEDARAAASERTRVIAFADASNVTGQLAPVAELVELARELGALTVLDACQSAPHRPIDLGALGVDAVVCSAHEMLGPSGLGVLYLRGELGRILPPARTGGAMIETIGLGSSTFAAPPARFEAGTQPVSQVVGLAAACGVLDEIGMARLAAHEERLGERMAAGLAAIPGVRLIGPPPGAARSGLAAFAVEGVHPHDVAQLLDDRGIAVRAGHHCAQPLHRRLGLAASTRASSHAATSEAEIDRLLEAVAEARRFFGAAGAAGAAGAGGAAGAAGDLGAGEAAVR